MASPEEMTKVEKPPFLNRSRLLKMLGISAACFAVLGMIINYSGNRQGKEMAPAETAPDIKVPDFGEYRNRSGVSPSPDTDIPSMTYLVPPVEIEKTPRKESERVAVVYTAPVQSAPPPLPRRAGEKTLEETARESPLIPALQGRLLSTSEAALLQDASSSPGIDNSLPAQPPQAATQGSSFSDILSNALSSSGAASSYDTQNMQDNKQAFYKGNASNDSRPVSGSFLEEDTLWNGTVIPAVLISGINTDLPGDVQARVTMNVYDSQTGKNLLVPQGTILIASYNSSVSFAQSRVQIVWNTLIRPDGYTLNLDGMNAVDNEGYSGVKGRYRENLFQYAKAMGIVSLFSVLNGQVSGSMDVVDNQAARDAITANQNVINQLGTRIIDKALDIQPTITVKNGTTINVMLNKHLLLPPVEDYRVSTKYVRR